MKTNKRIKRLEKLELKVKRDLSRISMEKEQLDILIKRNKNWQRKEKLRKIEICQKSL